MVRTRAGAKARTVYVLYGSWKMASFRNHLENANVMTVNMKASAKVSTYALNGTACCVVCKRKLVKDLDYLLDYSYIEYFLQILELHAPKCQITGTQISTFSVVSRNVSTSVSEQVKAFSFLFLRK